MKVLLWLVVSFLFALLIRGTDANAQTSSAAAGGSTGIDVIVVMEGSNRYDDPAAERFDMLGAMAAVLSADALYIDHGAQHTMTLITHDDDTSRVVLDAFELGSYAQEGDPAFADPIARDRRADDLSRIDDLLVDEQQRQSGTSLGGAEGHTNGYDSAFGAVANTLRARAGAEREPIVFVLYPNRPHLANGSGFFAVLSRSGVRQTLGNTPIYTLMLPVDRTVERNPSLLDENGTAEFIENWQAQLQRGNFVGELVANVMPADAARIAVDYLLPMLETVDADGIERQTIANTEELMIPPLVASATFIGVGDFDVDMQGTRTVTDSLDQHVVTVIENPVPGVYAVRGSAPVQMILNFSAPALELTANNAQWQIVNIHYTLNDTFKRPLSGNPTSDMGISASVTHIGSGMTWERPLNAEDAIGNWSGTFIPPYSGEYTIRLRVDMSGLSALPISITSPDTQKLNVKPARIALIDGDSNALDSLSTTLFVANTLAFSVEGGDTNRPTLPILYLTLPENQTTITSNTLAVESTDGSYSVDNIRFIHLANSGQPSILQGGAILTLPQQPNKVGETVFPLPENAFEIPVRVTTPAMIISDLQVTQPILTAMGYSAALGDTDAVTSADLIESGAVACAFISPVSAETSVLVPMQAQDSRTFSPLRAFIPTIPERHTVTIQFRDGTCEGELIAKAAASAATAQPIYLSLLDESGVPNDISLRQFLPASLSIGFVTLGSGGTLIPVGRPLDTRPALEFDGQMHQPDAYGIYTVRLPRVDDERATAVTINANYVDINGDTQVIEFAPPQQGNTLTLPVARASLIVGVAPAAGQEARQFNQAEITVDLQSSDGVETYDMQRLNADSGDVFVTISYGEEESLIKLDFITARNVYAATIPLSLGTTYTVVPEIHLNGRVVRTATPSEVQTLTVAPLSLRFVGDDTANPLELYAEQTATYEMGWFSEGGTSPIRESFPVEPTIRFGDGSTARTVDRKNGTYKFAWFPTNEGEHSLETTWSAPSLDATTVSGISERIDVSVLPITPVYVQLTCGDVFRECPHSASSNEIDYVQLWGRGAGFWNRTLVGVSETPQIRFDVLLRREVNGDGSSGERSIVSFADAFGTRSPSDVLNVEISDKNGNVLPTGSVTLTTDGAAADGAVRLTLNDVREDLPVTVRVGLKDNIMPEASYVIRRASSATYTTVLSPDQITFSLPIVAAVVTMGIFSVTVLIIFGIRRYVETRPPLLPSGSNNSYLQFVSGEKTPLGWSADISQFGRNTWRFPYNKKWVVSDVAELEISTVRGEPDAVEARVWSSSGPGNFRQKLIQRLRRLSMFSRPKPQSTVKLEKDKPVAINNSGAYLLLSAIPPGAPVQTSGRRGYSHANPTVEPPGAQTMPTENSLPDSAPPPPHDAAEDSISDQAESSEPVQPTIEFADDTDEPADEAPFESSNPNVIPSSRPRRNFDDDPFN